MADDPEGPAYFCPRKVPGFFLQDAVQRPSNQAPTVESMNAAGRAQSATGHWRRRRKTQRLADDVARVTVAGMIVASVLFLLLPLAMTLSMSFDARDYLGAFPPPAFSLRWYTKFFSDPYLLKGLKTSVELAALTALAATALGLSAAVALDRLPRRYGQLLIALLLLGDVFDQLIANQLFKM